MTTSITLDSLSRHIGDVRAVDGVTLTVERGELFFLLGPSGCGKTTMLRLIAGFLEPTSGRVRFGERDVTTLAPNKRNAGMVFQSYALWPHMTVLENVMFGLGTRKVPRRERRQRATSALAAVRMESRIGRKPGELSGGQQQRVALARALVVEPDVLLLDEPLSNLDAKLRLEMRAEIRRLCKASGITTIYVTHDQAEALSMADRMAVMRDGKIVQTGPPREVYTKPVSRFVAEFLGETNLLPVTITGRRDAGVELDSPAGRLMAAAAPERNGAKLMCSIRPEALRLGSADDQNCFEAKHLETIYLGGAAQHLLRLPSGQTLKLSELNPRAEHPTGTVTLSVAPDDVTVLEDDGSS